MIKISPFKLHMPVHIHVVYYNNALQKTTSMFNILLDVNLFILILVFILNTIKILPITRATLGKKIKFYQICKEFFSPRYIPRTNEKIFNF